MDNCINLSTEKMRLKRVKVTYAPSYTHYPHINRVFKMNNQRNTRFVKFFQNVKIVENCIDFFEVKNIQKNL